MLIVFLIVPLAVAGGLIAFGAGRWVNHRPRSRRFRLIATLICALAVVPVTILTLVGLVMLIEAVQG